MTQQFDFDFLLSLYERFGDKAQSALDFVKANSQSEKKEVPTTELRKAEAMPSNGVYIIYEDGSYTQFAKEDEEECVKTGVKYIGIIHDGHSFAVTLKELGRFKLVKDYEKCPKTSELYIQRECDALNDWDCVTRTKHIQEVGTDIPLKEGEYIPALPMLVAMMYWRDRGLNDALKFVGGDPIPDAIHWSSTECSSSGAWRVHGETGNVTSTGYYYGKTGSYVVRAVCAWEI